MNALLRTLRFVVALFFAAAIVAYASGPTQVFHSFTCNGRNDTNKWAETIDLLAYSYGDQYRMVRRSVVDSAEKEWLKKNGATSLSGCLSVSGPMPIGEFLYVKWRIKATGEVFEDRVDLRELLPKNLTNHDLTFSIDGKQLHVYVATPFPRKLTRTDPSRPWAVSEKPTHLSWKSERYWVYEIYPALEQYPTPTNLTSEQIGRCLKGDIACAANTHLK